jgi:hypothetical protein
VGVFADLEAFLLADRAAHGDLTVNARSRPQVVTGSGSPAPEGRGSSSAAQTSPGPRSTPLSRQACVLFWTLWCNQVGRAALAGWEGLVVPALRGKRSVGLWPFDGPLDDLFTSRSLVIAETYPAEFYAHLARRRFSKRDATQRRNCASALIAAASRLKVCLSQAARRDVEAGFHNDNAFDAFVGVLGIVNVLRGHRPADPPPCVAQHGQ